MEQLKEPVRVFIVDNFLFGDGGGLKDESPLLGGGVIDSTGILELVSFLEKRFSIKIDDEEMLPENLGLRRPDRGVPRPQGGRGRLEPSRGEPIDAHPSLPGAKRRT